MIHAAPQGTGAALQDKLHCFLHRHEIALFVLMRDGKRTVAAELPLEEGNERAAAPKHIAEKHRNKTGAAVTYRDRKSVVSGKRVCVSVHFGVRHRVKIKTTKLLHIRIYLRTYYPY